MAEERPYTIDVAMPAPSPTGRPLIPPSAVPYVALGLVALTAVSEEVANPGPWTAARVLSLAVQLGGLVLGVASPGMRR